MRRPSRRDSHTTMALVGRSRTAFVGLASSPQRASRPQSLLHHAMGPPKLHNPPVPWSFWRSGSQTSVRLRVFGAQSGRSRTKFSSVEHGECLTELAASFARRPLLPVEKHVRMALEAERGRGRPPFGHGRRPTGELAGWPLQPPRAPIGPAMSRRTIGHPEWRAGAINSEWSGMWMSSSFLCHRNTLWSMCFTSLASRSNLRSFQQRDNSR